MSELILRALPKITVFGGQRPRLLSLLLFIVTVMAVSIFFVWARLQVVNLEYDISSLESRLRATTQQSQQLRLEAASLRSPARIEKLARTQLSLRFPAPSQIFIVD